MKRNPIGEVSRCDWQERVIDDSQPESFHQRGEGTMTEVVQVGIRKTHLQHASERPVDPPAAHALEHQGGGKHNARSHGDLHGEKAARPQALEVDGVILTKLDGTAKGGVVVAIAGELGIPIRYIGVGEGLDDLRQFDARQFVAALLAPSGQDALDT